VKVCIYQPLDFTGFLQFRHFEVGFSKVGGATPPQREFYAE